MVLIDAKRGEEGGRGTSGIPLKIHKNAIKHKNRGPSQIFSQPQVRI